MSNTDPNEYFSQWLKKKMESEGRKWEWLSEQTGISYSLMHYKKENDTFSIKEEEVIKEALDK